MENAREISSKNITKKRELGRGYFGTVYEAAWYASGRTRSVAVKKLRNLIPSDFYREVEVMASLNHPRIIKLYGICKEPPLMILELASTSALDYIRNNSTDTKMHLQWSAQIAEGMEYLEDNRLAHRDLALRNILLDFDENAKISDFGMSRAMTGGRSGEYYYRMTSEGVKPLFWCAPESIEYDTFNSCSDVWSYGVTTWEIFSKGQSPYNGLHTENELITFLLVRQKRLWKPSGCPDEVYQLMLQCWNIEPNRRPTFATLSEEFDRLHRENHDEANGVSVAAVAGGIALAALAVWGGYKLAQALRERDSDSD